MGVFVLSSISLRRERRLGQNVIHVLTFGIGSVGEKIARRDSQARAQQHETAVESGLPQRRECPPSSHQLASTVRPPNNDRPATALSWVPPPSFLPPHLPSLGRRACGSLGFWHVYAASYLRWLPFSVPCLPSRAVWQLVSLFGGLITPTDGHRRLNSPGSCRAVV